MISDRNYMQDDYQRETTSAVVWLICAMVAGFVLQNVFEHWFQEKDFLYRFFSVTIPGLSVGRIWTLGTYVLLHSTSNLLEIFFVLLSFFFIGREVLTQIGTRRFLGLFAAIVIGGGLAWTATNWRHGGALFGATTAVYGLLAVYAAFNPNRPITLLLFFILPVSIKPKYLAYIALFIDSCGFLFYEVMQQPSPFGFAHSAHLGGMAVGWIYFRYVHNSDWSQVFRRNRTERAPFTVPTTKRTKEKRAVAEAKLTPQRLELRAEVDRILDKINSQGFGSLTPEEKRTLDQARDLLSRH